MEKIFVLLVPCGGGPLGPPGPPGGGGPGGGPFGCWLPWAKTAPCNKIGTIELLKFFGYP